MPRPSAEIFSQGAELMSGDVTDSNAAYLAGELTQLGFAVTRQTTADDNLPDLVCCLQEISARCDVCLCSGGLGPTVDDLTSLAASTAFAAPLAIDQKALANTKKYFQNRAQNMPASNNKQAYLPQGSACIGNDLGSAAGFTIQYGKCWFVFLPGVPSEMKAMFAGITGEICQRFSPAPAKIVSIKTTGIGESSLQDKIGDLGDEAQLGFRATPSLVEVKLAFADTICADAITKCVASVAAKLGNAVFAIDHQHENTTLPYIIDRLMQDGQHTLAVVETLAAGNIAAACNAYSWLHYSEFKVQSKPLDKDGAIALAQQSYAQNNCDLQLAQYMANPAGDKKLHNILLAPNQTIYQSSQKASPYLALNFLRLFLQSNAAT